MKKYLLGLMVLCSTSYADCYIQVNSCQPGKNVLINQLFRDALEPRIQEDPNRCLQRAREFLNYCHSGRAPSFASATAYYYSGGAWKTASVVTASGSYLYTTNSAGAWTLLQNHY